MLLLFGSWLPAQEAIKCDKPLGEEDIADLLQGSVAEARVKEYVTTCGVSFELSREVENRLRALGASDLLIESLPAASRGKEAPSLIQWKISDYQGSNFPNFSSVLIPSRDIQQLEILLQGAPAEIQASSVRIKVNDRPFSTFVSLNPLPRGVRALVGLGRTLSPDLRLRAEGTNIITFEASDSARATYFGQLFLEVGQNLEAPRLGTASVAPLRKEVQAAPTYSPPQIAWKGPPAVEASQETALLDVEIADSQGLRRVVIEVNGKDVEEIFLENDRPVRKRGGFQFSARMPGTVQGDGKHLNLSLPVELKKGANVLAVRAENSVGLRSRAEQTVARGK